jgi:hypothetical protein
MKTRFFECIATALIPFAIAMLPTSSLATVNTLGQLTCSAEEVALFDGVAWVCSDLLNDFTADLEALEQALSDEEAARIAGDAGLQAQITDLRQDLEAEEQTRANEDGLLWGQIDALNDLVGFLADECEEGEAVVGIELVNGSYQIVCSEGGGLPTPEGCPCYTPDALLEWQGLFEWVRCSDMYSPEGPQPGYYTELNGYFDPETPETLPDAHFRTTFEASEPPQFSCQIANEATGTEFFVYLESVDQYEACRTILIESPLWDLCFLP